MNRFALTFTVLRLPIDTAMLACAAAMAYLLRYSRFATEVRPLFQDIPVTSYIQTSITFIAVWIFVFIIAGLYSTRSRPPWETFGRITLACTAAVMILIASVFFRRELTQSRFIILAIWAFSIFFVFFGRVALHLIERTLLKRGFGHEPIAIIGKDSLADNLFRFFKQNPLSGFTPVRHIEHWTETAQQQLKRLASKDRLRGIILADPNLPKSDALAIIHFANTHHLQFWYGADVFAARFTNISVITPGGIPLIEVKPTPLEGWGRILKRAMDLSFALFFMILLSPIWIFGAILVLLEDGFPILFKNERIGERGKRFTTYKLRTMFRKYSIGPQFNNEKENLAYEKELIQKQSIKKGPVYKIAKDPRILRLGHFLRRWSIDEIPNFISVLMGDMALVGPRPHQPREVAQYTEAQRRVLAIKPGVTGLAQISGRSDLTFEEEIRLDIWYIENWSPLLDLYILIKTPFAVLFRTGAY